MSSLNLRDKFGARSRFWRFQARLTTPTNMKRKFLGYNGVVNFLFVAVIDCFQAFLPRHEFWPPLLKAHFEATPLACRTIAACCCLSFQNCDAERDLATLKKIQTRTCSQLDDDSLNARARIRISGPDCDKKRNERVTGFIATLAQSWASRNHRQLCPNPCKSSSTLGNKCPQRARKRRAGEIRQSVEVSVEGEVCPDLSEEEVDPEDLCAFLRG